MSDRKIKYSLALMASLMVAENSQAAQKTEVDNNSNQSIPHNLFASRCPERIPTRSGDTTFSVHDYPQKYYQVTTTTGDLRLRATPGGDIVGSIPSGWQVYVAKFDFSGRWAYVRDVYSPYYSEYGWASAPNFRSDGWVSVDYLQYIGQFCSKPRFLSLMPENTILSIAENELSNHLWSSLETEILDKLNRKSS
ncbi:hypothetical protein IQ215_12385 [Cyanobacterium stanieri LEGE 03274]|uniref:SH3b domain-containing protein n=1 Tax=Cyanobacterium stanieri LEGE 03274 TaxID=1828756 RepID=A0ABR9V7I9_9CHRO|nr:hypothetical protein [Cyanobacterium stanieri]MBE9223494.1 hypothetical protein [Cyanobacterium stanieri LEGE 03274]